MREQNFTDRDVYLRGLTIERGNANGTGKNCTGAGMLILTGKPKLEFNDIRYNTANCSGGGIYVAMTGGISYFKNCLIEQNVSKNGNGAGLFYLSEDPLTIDASVFDQNQTSNTSANNGGSALYLKKTHVVLINSVFARNTSMSSKGAVLNSNSKEKHSFYKSPL